MLLTHSCAFIVEDNFTIFDFDFDLMGKLKLRFSKNNFGMTEPHQALMRAFNHERMEIICDDKVVYTYSCIPFLTPKSYNELSDALPLIYHHIGLLALGRDAMGAAILIELAYKLITGENISDAIGLGAISIPFADGSWIEAIDKETWINCKTKIASHTREVTFSLTKRPLSIRHGEISISSTEQLTLNDVTLPITKETIDRVKKLFKISD